MNVNSSLAPITPQPVKRLDGEENGHTKATNFSAPRHERNT